MANNIEEVEKQAEEDRRKIQDLLQENRDLRVENRRLLEERRSGGDFFGMLMKISLIILGISFVAYIWIPLYIVSQHFAQGMFYPLKTSLQNWRIVAGFLIYLSAGLSFVSFFTSY